MHMARSVLRVTTDGLTYTQKLYSIGSAHTEYAHKFIFRKLSAHNLPNLVGPCTIQRFNSSLSQEDFLKRYINLNNYYISGNNCLNALSIDLHTLNL